MKCDKVLPQLSDYIDELLTTEDKNLLEEHMKQCSSCANELQKLSKTVALVRSLPKMSAPVNLQQEISRAITPTPWLKIYQNLSLAAGLLLSFVLGMWFVVFQNPERFATESAVAKSQEVPQNAPKIQKQNARNEIKRIKRDREKDTANVEPANNLKKTKYRKKLRSGKKNETPEANEAVDAEMTVAKEEASKFTEQKISRMNEIKTTADQKRALAAEAEEIEDADEGDIEYADDAGMDYADEKADVAPGDPSQVNVDEMDDTESADSTESAEMDDDFNFEATQGGAGMAQQTHTSKNDEQKTQDSFANDAQTRMPKQPQKIIPKPKDDKIHFGKGLNKNKGIIEKERAQRRDRKTQTNCNKCHVKNIKVMHEQLVSKISIKNLYTSLAACNECHMILDEKIIREGHTTPKIAITSMINNRNGNIVEQIFVVQKMVQLEYALRGLATAQNEGRFAMYMRQIIAMTVSTLRNNEYAYNDKYIKPIITKVGSAELRIGNSKLQNLANFVRNQAQAMTLLPVEELNNEPQIPQGDIAEDDVLEESKN
ncbi:anti-sigma factor family protein [Candidatus Uabimicrobium amorphum]|uniref:Putative zinc-finger domain-containing protein n=1 Tax=Uabimicrobium amorphum TaxID=2596890 RepID=A0A5S9F4X4_UABAM|nr:zf-HC2 domain-containing protein [Candidatus Uabimicrobium amorphum]BBM85563.1 hypothetical protein UABAM_03933 [Candidatus Uabimicrobium amorphum]